MWKVYRDLGPRVIVAMDFPTLAGALKLADELDPARCRLKVGSELFTRSGLEGVKALQRRGFDIFLDLKFHDIPNTVAKACLAAADLGVWMLTVHTLGGMEMLRAVTVALSGLGSEKPLVMGVTILTSLEEDGLREVGLFRSLPTQVLGLAEMAKFAGLDGVVCSSREVLSVREGFGSDFLLVTPGIRLGGMALHDQVRVMTAREAVELGSDYLVVGRPITEAAAPLAVLDAIENELL